ncbi:S-layer homology domain-containing protein [Cohnella herbarum]|uniref:S-layer homology domain-containing protein n=1 Tax=Cohnella herbarum TaxID=2728023 RepID=A0A7Z2ZNK1_9BACL|nr:S-layer homology domain-containing protein [Cohnella herbarum]QJD86526.1 S-layer homology domain-containing protein [Cohnella herbarum]
MNRKLKKSVAIAMTSTMLLAYAPLSSAATTTETIPAWASAEMSSWKGLGLLQGDRQGNLLPNQTVTKAEFLAFVNRVFNYRLTSDKTFGDVSPTAWYADEISKAYAAGILQGNAKGDVSPLATLTREEAAIILSRVFDIVSSGSTSFKFADDDKISTWATEAVYAMKDAGYVEGTNGEFQPRKGLTRAEAVKMINNVMGTLVADSSSHANVQGGNVVVNTAGGTLSNAKIKGNLYITPGVGEGDFTINGSEIGGTVFVLGGGEHSIIFKNSKAKKVKIFKPSGPLRFVLTGTSSADAFEVLTGAQIVNESSNPIAAINVSSNATDTVGVSGNVIELTFNSNGTLNIGEGIISNLIFSKLSKGGKAKLDAKAKIGKMIANAAVTVTGDGEVAEVTINADGVVLVKIPLALILNAANANIGGKDVTKGWTSTGGTGGGGGGSGGPKPDDMSTKLYDRATVLNSFSDTGAQGNVKKYLQFLGDSTYDPEIANNVTYLPELLNAETFVNKDFTVKPSIFPSMRGVNTSVLTLSREFLWIGTDDGVTKINLSSNAMTNYTKENKQLPDNRVLLLISDGSTGVYAITDTGVSYIRQ